MRQRLGTTFAFLGDEIYLRAGQPVPGRKHYGDYPQIEDGIGMVRSFANQFEAMRRRIQSASLSTSGASGGGLFGTIMTGTLFAPVLRKMIERLNARVDTRLHVLAVDNSYFGGDVSVAGLLSGGDFLAARDKVVGDFTIIPRVALKSDEAIMLDGMSFEELKGQFEVPVHALDFAGLAQMLTRTPQPVQPSVRTRAIPAYA